MERSPQLKRIAGQSAENRRLSEGSMALLYPGRDTEPIAPMSIAEADSGDIMIRGTGALNGQDKTASGAGVF